MKGNSSFLNGGSLTHDNKAALPKKDNYLFLVSDALPVKTSLSCLEK
jgi:hypothetical protein